MTTMTTTPQHVRDATMLELRAAVEVGDETLEIERRTRMAGIRARLDEASAGPWYKSKDRDGVIRVHRTGCASYSRIANILRSGNRPDKDAELIAHAPDDLVWLLAEITRVRAERDLLLERAADDAKIAYWALRAEARGQEITARRVNR